MLAPRFGLASQDHAIDLLEERVKNAGSLDSIGVDMTLRVIYQSGYGIFNHHQYQAEVKNHVGLLKLVAFHDKEDLVNMNRRQNVKRRFAESGVGRIFNIGFTEFLQYPSEECDDMIEIARDITARKSKQYAGVLGDLEDH